MNEKAMFLLMVFTVVLFMSQAFVAPLMGTRKDSKKLLRERIKNLGDSVSGDTHAERVRQKKQQNLSRFERWIESLPQMERLAIAMAQAGSDRPAYHLLLQCLGIALLFGALTAWRTENLLLSLLLALVGAGIPLFLLQRRRTKRMQQFEEQLPDALSVAARSLKAGLPFIQALKIVSKEMKPPVSTEFEQVFGELNYGGDLRSALLGLLQRMPTVAVMGVVTAVLIQRDTGGNLAEVLERIASLIRERFKFQRSVKTLTAEARGTAWVVSIGPFVLAAATELLKPGWVTDLVNDPTGQQMIIGAFILLLVGILWLKRLTSIDV